ncbi:MAG: hypothetical protein KL787_07565 [Taibaiella sp.]|nr:hypothetical protein [Taibaiella sp.]
MIPNVLFPNYFKWIGLMLFIGGYSYAVSYPYDPDDVAHVQGLYIQITILAGLLFIAGAREKREDERAKYCRLTSLQWSIFLLIFLRVTMKAIAFYKQDPSWLPFEYQVNFLLVLYLLLFYYQLYAKDFLLNLFYRTK